MYLIVDSDGVVLGSVSSEEMIQALVVKQLILQIRRKARLYLAASPAAVIKSELQRRPAKSLPVATRTFKRESLPSGGWCFAHNEQVCAGYARN